MKIPGSSQSTYAHLVFALAAVLTTALTLGAVETFVRWRLPASLDRFAAMMPPVKLTGNLLQTTAFRTPDLLTIYGSSELDRPAENRPDAFFLHRPTGFGVFPIGRAGNTCILILEKIAAAGEAARGGKVVIFLSPSWFLRDAGPDAVDSNLRPRQLGAWVFGDALSPGLKRDIARRLRVYPETLARDPLLARAVADLAADEPASRFEFALLEPLGWMQNFVLARAEAWALLRDLPTLFPSRRQRIQNERHRLSLPAATTAPDWDRLATEAEAYDRAQGDTSPFSVGSPTRDEKRYREREARDEAAEEAAPKSVAHGERDADFHAKLTQSMEWQDLSLLLRVLRELRMDALVISQPFNGVYRDYGGNTPEARREYYDRLGTVVRQAGFQAEDFSEHEEDRTFFNDSGHPSGKAWIFYDHALDGFFASQKGAGKKHS